MNGREMQSLQEALCSAFDQHSFDAMLRFKLDKDRSHIAGSGSLSETTFRVIDAAVREGWHRDLIRAACEYVPNSPALQRFCAENPHLAPGGGGDEERQDAALAGIRRELLTAATSWDLRRVMYQVKVFLAEHPNSVEGRLLQDQVVKAASQIEVLDYSVHSEGEPVFPSAGGESGGLLSIPSCLAVLLLVACSGILQYLIIG